ncbi:MAG: T9SS type A sorting domain-containing protein, partial [Ignavibacteriaceae bacterium]
LVFPSVLLDNNEYRMWFQGWQGGTASIGYATSSVTNVNEESYGYMIKDFILYQNYPNPFNPQTVISYKIRARSNVVIKINDVLGKEISTLVNEEKDAGTYEVTFNGGALPSGIYYYKITIGNYSDTKKMILLK